tara:strand:+ start:48 stop:911 length:864 start_codon:yes stop_codon:yes gene_type:complete
MALTKQQEAQIKSLKEQISVYDKARGTGWKKEIDSLRNRIKNIMATQKQKPKPKKVEKKPEPEPEPVEVEDESQAAKEPPKPKRKPIRKPLVKKDQSGKKLIELAKRDELKQKQKRAKLYKEREANRQAKIRKAADKRVRKISPTQTSQLVAPSQAVTVRAETQKPPPKQRDSEQPKSDKAAKKDDSRSGLAQFWEDVKDLPSNLAKDFLPKQIKGSKEEGYTQEREDMGPGKRKYKWGDTEFTLDTTEKAMTEGRKKGGRIKKGAKKTKVRKRAALRGHRAELRGG